MGAGGTRALQRALAKEHYVDAHTFAVERERVLVREWFCVGRLSALGIDRPGRLAVVDALGESVLVTRRQDGALAAHYNVCRHRGSQLVPVQPQAPVPAACDAKAIRCPYHSWTYDLDGRLLKAPHTDDVSGFEPSAFGLHPVGVDVWGGFVFLHLTPDVAGPLADAIGSVDDRVRRYPLADLVVGATLLYDVRANWKLICENYNECYHCAGVHPELCRLVPAFARGGRDLAWADGIPLRPGAWTFSADGTSDRAPFPDLDAAERVRHKGELVQPNLLLSLSADHVAAFTLWPTAHDETRVECALLFAADEVARPAFDPSDVAGFWDVVNRQDWAVCESTQRGMSSRAYVEGWYAPMEDESLDVGRWLLPRLGRQP
jgi:Rieske 2Fe-2S family protein